MTISNPQLTGNPQPICLLGAISGDVIGSVYEFSRQKSYDFPLFTPKSRVTDDSILTIAVADAILHRQDYLSFIRSYALSYPNSGYGGFFRKWMNASDPHPYNSYGNGSAMRVSAVGWAFDTLEDVLIQAERSAVVTHDHPEGIKGAQAAALSVFLARTGQSRESIRQEIEARFGYELGRTLEEIRPGYEFNETCQQTVPEAIIAFLESRDFEDAIRKAVSLGGDADTLAAITGSIAEAFYGGVPAMIFSEVRSRIRDELWKVIEEFDQKYGLGAARM